MPDERRGDWMQTFSGHPFWPLDPRPEEVHIEDIAHHLSMICRYNGAVRTFYSVAEHSVLLCRTVQRRLPNDHREQLQALLHDGAEAYLCDVVRPVKKGLAGYAEAEIRVEEAIRDRFGLMCSGKSPLVDELDNLILYDESRALLPASTTWHQAYAPGLGEPIWGWTPRDAESKFLMEFRRLTVDCPCCHGSGQEPTYGPHFDHDGDNMPTGYVTCGGCHGARRLAPVGSQA